MQIYVLELPAFFLCPASFVSSVYLYFSTAFRDDFWHLGRRRSERKNADERGWRECWKGRELSCSFGLL